MHRKIAIYEKRLAGISSRREIYDMIKYLWFEKAKNTFTFYFMNTGTEVIMNNLELKKIANEVRKGIVTAVHSAKAGHPGGSLSAADIYTVGS